jgi:WD40 repeat protein
MPVSRSSTTDRDRLTSLSIFPPAIEIPIDVLCSFWELDRPAAESAVLRLADLSLLRLVDLATGVVRIHDTIRLVLHGLSEGQRTSWHERLISTLGELSPYYWRYIAYHLAALRRHDDIWALLRDVGWLQRKVAASDIASAILDLSFLPPRPEVKSLQRALVASAHVLSRDPSQLSSQLAGRLPAGITTGEQHVGRLRPVRPSLQQADGPLVRRLDGHERMVYAIALSNDDRFAVTAGADDLLIWDLEQIRPPIRCSYRGAMHLSFMAAANRFLSATSLGQMHLWDAESGAQVREFRGPPTVERLCAIDERSAVIQSHDGPIMHWDLDEARPLRVYESPKAASENPSLTSSVPLFSHGLTLTGDVLLAAKGIDAMAIWSFATGDFRGYCDAVSPTITMQFSSEFPITAAWRPRSRFLLTSSTNGAVSVWDVAKLLRHE